ncbi:MAG: type II toxin-antitoxin system VapC family toxin [Longimicrobiales bacterium]
MLLVDTSAWIEFFRRGGNADLEALARVEEFVTCPPVIQEVLQGFRDERAYRTARTALLALPALESPLDVEVFLEAADLYRRARRAGITVRSSVDCLIAACALRHDVEVCHLDRDYDALSRVAPLRVRRV